MTCFHMKKAKKKFFFQKKKFKMADSKKQRFSKLPILKFFLRKFHRLVLGTKQPKNTKNAFSTCFCPYVRQPHDHIGWAELMAFASINPTNPRTNLWNFRENFLRIGDLEKLSFFELAILNFYFASFPWKSAQIYMVEWMGWNFDVFSGFQKIPCYA